MNAAELISDARRQLENGDEKGAIKLLDHARAAAKGADDLEALSLVLNACAEFEPKLGGRNASAVRRVGVAAKQNQAFIERRDAQAGNKAASSASVEEQQATPNIEANSRAEPSTSDDGYPIRADVEAAKARMRSTFGSRRELKKLDEYLWHDERVLRMVKGSLHGNLGLLVHTDRRLIFLFHGLVRQQNEDFALDTISAISVKAGMVTATITVYSAGAKHDIANVFKDDAKAITDEIRNRIATRTHAPPPTQSPLPAPPSQTEAKADPLVQLKQLGELHEAGVLTDEEFEAKKTELLSRL